MTVHFLPGQFYGVPQDRSHGGVFEISVLAASAPEDAVRMHMHEDAHFVLVLAGIYLSVARGAPEFARAPALVYNPPGTTHRDRFLGGQGRFMAISIDPARLAGVDALRGVPAASSYVQQPSCLRTAFALARGMQGVHDAALLESGVWELLAHTDARPGRERRLPPWLHLAYDALMDEAGDPGLSIGAIAAHAGVHPVHLARAFRANLGCSPGELLRWRRLQHACAMLRQAGRGMAEVAADAGFVDQSHMSHAFRQRFGMPPGAWRRRMFNAYKTQPFPAE